MGIILYYNKKRLSDKEQRQKGIMFSGNCCFSEKLTKCGLNYPVSQKPNRHLKMKLGITGVACPQ